MSVTLSRLRSDGNTDLYRYFDADGRLLYVGISVSAVARAAQHRRTATWWGDFANMTREVFPTRFAAEEAERRAIVEEKPVYNVMHSGSSVLPAKAPTWICAACRKPNVDGYLQTWDHAERPQWDCVCRQCDGQKSPKHYIRITDVATLDQITEVCMQISEQSWLDWDSFALKFEMYCSIPGVAQHVFNIVFPGGAKWRARHAS